MFKKGDRVEVIASSGIFYEVGAQGTITSTFNNGKQAKVKFYSGWYNNDFDGVWWVEVDDIKKVGGNTMRKQDLVAGKHFVTTRCGEPSLLIKDGTDLIFIGEDGSRMRLFDLNDDLKNKWNSLHDVMRVGVYHDCGKTLSMFDDVKWVWKRNEFYKGDLENKMVVVTQCGWRFVVIDDTLVSVDGWMRLDDYEEDLTFFDGEETNEDYDIVEIYRYENDSGVSGLKFMLTEKSRDLELIWKRE